MTLTPELVHEQLLFIAIAGVLTLLIGFFAWNLGYFKFPYRRDPDMPRLRTRDLVGAFFVFLGTEFILLPLLVLIIFFPHLPSEKETLFKDPILKGWLNAGAMFLVTLSVITYNFLNRSAFKTVWGEGSFKGWRFNLHHVLIGIASWLISYPLVLLVSQVISLSVSELFHPSRLEQMAVEQVKSTFQSPPLYATTWFLVVFLVPIVEEMLFRGYLQTWIRQSLGTKRAILLSSAVFALFHFSTSQGLGNIELLGALFVLASFLGFIYEREQSLWAPIALHSTFNIVSIAMLK